MSENMQFVRNYSDLSNDRGFQFEFNCDRCGNAIRTPFTSSKSGAISDVLETASGFLGGILGGAAEISNRMHSATYRKAHDEALVKAIANIKPQFIQCPRCQAWVCRTGCWNTKKGLCKECSPDLGVEMSAAQSNRSVEEIWAHAAMAEEDKKLGKENWRETIMASCPQCEAPLAANAKFCPECGANLKKSLHCTECGAKLQPNAKFCGECGHKTA